MRREPLPYALPVDTVIHNPNRLHPAEHAELIDAHAVNRCDDGGDLWDCEGADPLEGLAILEEVEAFQELFEEL